MQQIDMFAPEIVEPPPRPQLDHVVVARMRLVWSRFRPTEMPEPRKMPDGGLVVVDDDGFQVMVTRSRDPYRWRGHVIGGGERGRVTGPEVDNPCWSLRLAEAAFATMWEG